EGETEETATTSNKTKLRGEAYEATEEGQLALYLEQLEEAAKAVATAQGCGQSDELKAMRIARNIMAGKQVPAQDESFLITYSFKLYMAAKNIGSLKENTGKAKSVLNGTENPGPDTAAKLAGSSGRGGSGNSISAETLDGAADRGESLFSTEFKSGMSDSGSIAWNAKDNLPGTVSGTLFSRMSTNTTTKKHKKLNYSFKQISAMITNAKTSAGARQVLSQARAKTTQLRRQLKSGNYDDEEVEMAITHAEAMERVAKKKMENLEEEERASRQLGVNGSGIDWEEVDDRQDEQAQALEDALAESGYSGQDENLDDTDISGDESLEEIFTEAVANGTDAGMDELSEIMSESMIDLLDEFSEEMEDVLDETEELSDLTDELGGVSVERTTDPEDLKRLKQKHRSEEQRKIAEADSKYLKEFFEKLQKERSSAAKSAVQLARSVGGGTSITAAVASTSSAASVTAASASSGTSTAAISETMVAADAGLDAVDSVSVDEAVATVAEG
ncbi:MAG: hypothetical protein LUI02_00875, partial [Clostridiales bacterium]|nr:hypothetical protein [Clostridiales bacterium]